MSLLSGTLIIHPEINLGLRQRSKRSTYLAIISIVSTRRDTVQIDNISSKQTVACVAIHQGGIKLLGE